MTNLLDIIDVSDYNKVKIPTLCTCISCGGYLDFYNGKEYDLTKSERKEFAWQIAMIDYGKNLQLWKGYNVANRFQVPKKCECECDHSNSETKTIANCYHKFTCLDCGFTTNVDSSD